MANVDTTLNLMFKTADLTLNMTNSALNLVNFIVKPINKNPENEAWVKAIENDAVDVITCRTSQEKKDLIKDLEVSGVTYKDYGNMVFVLQEDANKVDQVLDNMPVSKETAEKSMASDVKRGFVELNVDSTDALNFIKRFNENNVKYSISSCGFNDKYRFVIPDTEYDKVCKIKLDVAFDNQGEYKGILERELQKEAKYKNDMLFKIGCQSEEIKNVIIADNDGSVIMCNNKYVSLSQNGIEISGTLKTKDLSDIQKKFFDMKQPTLITKEEYEQFNKTPNKEEFLFDKRVEQGVCRLSDDEKAIVLQHEKDRILFAQKLMQDHPAEIYADMDDYNNYQPLVLFKKAEKDNFEINHDIQVSTLENPDFLNDAFMEYIGFEIEEPEVDYEVLAGLEDRVFNESEARDESIQRLLDEANINMEELEEDVIAE